MDVTAIIPVKTFDRAKSRLLDALDRRQRSLMVKAMLEDVLAATTSARHVERVIVVTADKRAERVAMHRAKRATTPIEVLREARATGHSEAATLGIVRAKSLGAAGVALLPGDCPLLDPVELDAALGRLAEGCVWVVPDRHGEGTNAILMSPADAIGPSFGPGSRARHLGVAERRGLVADAEQLTSLALDLDTPDDLEALADVLLSQPSRAPRTADALDRLLKETPELRPG